MRAGPRAKRGWGPLALFYVVTMLIAVGAGPRLLLQGPPLSLIPLSAPLAVLLLSAAAIRDGLRQEKALQGLGVALISPLSVGLIGLMYHLRQEVDQGA